MMSRHPTLATCYKWVGVALWVTTQAAGTVYECKLEIKVTISWFTRYEMYHSTVQQYLYMFNNATYGILPLPPKQPLMDKTSVTSYM